MQSRSKTLETMNVWKLRKNFVTNFTLENYVRQIT